LKNRRLLFFNGLLELGRRSLVDPNATSVDDSALIAAKRA